MRFRLFLFLPCKVDKQWLFLLPPLHLRGDFLFPSPLRLIEEAFYPLSLFFSEEMFPLFLLLMIVRFK